jgi:hypothetical protein
MMSVVRSQWSVVRHTIAWGVAEKREETAKKSEYRTAEQETAE